MDSEESKATRGSDQYLKRKASYVVAAALAKRGCPFDDGHFFKELSNEVLSCFGVRSEEIRNIINNIPLPGKTIGRRTEDISAFIY